MKIEIPFLDNREPLTYEADSIAEAVARAVKEDADLTSADLSYAYLSDADLSYAYLSDADLSDADLSDVNLQRASLSNADLRYANLSDADLSNACLNGADLSNACLKNTDLSYANLNGADLRNANLRKTKLAGAKIQGKQLWITRPFLSLGQCGSANRTTLAFFFEDKSEPFIMCGCFKGVLSEFKARIKETHSGTFYEVEYNIMASHITEMHKGQQQQTRKEN